jgi:hypothetical protein
MKKRFVRKQIGERVSKKAGTLRDYLMEQASILYEASKHGDMNWVTMSNMYGAHGNPTLTQTCVALTNWRHTGFQSVEIGHKLAAALMATSAEGALKDQHLPWPCFEIRVPNELVRTSHGWVTSLFVSSIPDWLPIIYDEKYPNSVEHLNGVTMLYFDTGSTTGHVTLHKLEQFAQYEKVKDQIVDHDRLQTQETAELYNVDHETRVRAMLSRLVTGIILLINQARADKPEAYSTKTLRQERSGPAANTHRVEHGVTIDCVHYIRDYIAGKSKGAPRVSTLVRGFWREQAYGPKWSLHRRQWIEPFFRGSGPLTQRSTRLRGGVES